MHPDDTIVAVSSAAGPAARVVVRTSGPRAVAALRAVADDPPVAAGTVARARLRFADLACPAWVYCFLAPRSYTGEDLVEYHLPGNPVLAGLFVKHLQGGGMRPAEAGEFTARAYFNGRLDLTAAEGVAATIAAGSERELSAARRLLAGELARRLAPAMDLLARALALLEVGIDFSEEDVTFLDPADVRRQAEEVGGMLRSLLAEGGRLEPLAREPAFVLVGRPNAGKSTLLNALAGYERAVASPVAGTTRDALAAAVALPRGRVRVVDVAGLETEPDDAAVAGADGPAGDVRRRMRAAALRAVAEADFVLLVAPAGEGADPPAGLPRHPDLVVRSKSDLVPASGPAGHGGGAGVTEACGEARVSAATGAGLSDLRAAMDALAFGRGGGSEAGLALNVRHVAAVGRAVAAVDRAAALADGPVELCAAELRDALDALGGVLGRVSPDDLLGRIFSQFCIGK